MRAITTTITTTTAIPRTMATTTITTTTAMTMAMAITTITIITAMPVLPWHPTKKLSR